MVLYQWRFAETGGMFGFEVVIGLFVCKFVEFVVVAGPMVFCGSANVQFCGVCGLPLVSWVYDWQLQLCAKNFVGQIEVFYARRWQFYV